MAVHVLFLIVFALGVTDAPSPDVEGYIPKLIAGQPHAITQLKNDIAYWQAQLPSASAADTPTITALLQQLNAELTAAIKKERPILIDTKFPPRPGQITTIHVPLTIGEVLSDKDFSAYVGEGSQRRYLRFHGLPTAGMNPGEQRRILGLFWESGTAKMGETTVPIMEQMDEKPVIEAWQAALGKKEPAPPAAK